MMLSSSTDLITMLLQELDTITAGYVAHGYHALVAQYGGVINSIFVIAVAGYFAALLYGRIASSLGGVLVFLLKLTLIYTLATNWDYFYLHLYDLFTNGPQALTEVLMPGQNASSALDHYFNTGMSDASLIFQKYGLFSHYVLWSLGVVIVTLGTAGFSLLLLMLAKIAMALLLSLSPLFFCFALFESTKGIFDSYLRSLITYALIPVLLSGLLAIVLQLENVVLAPLTADAHSPVIHLTGIVPFLLFALPALGLLGMVKSKAAHLASGFSLHSIAHVGHRMANGAAMMGGWLNKLFSNGSSGGSSSGGSYPSDYSFHGSGQTGIAHPSTDIGDRAQQRLRDQR